MAAPVAASLLPRVPSFCTRPGFPAGLQARAAGFLHLVTWWSLGHGPLTATTTRTGVVCEQRGAGFGGCDELRGAAAGGCVRGDGVRGQDSRVSAPRRLRLRRGPPGGAPRPPRVPSTHAQPEPRGQAQKRAGGGARRAELRQPWPHSDADASPTRPQASDFFAAKGVSNALRNVVESTAVVCARPPARPAFSRLSQAPCFFHPPHARAPPPPPSPGAPGGAQRAHESDQGASQPPLAAA